MRSPGSYWQTSRAPRYSLLFALPLLLLYEALAAALDPAGVAVRNGADVVLRGAAGVVAGSRGGLVLGVLLVGGSLWLVWRDLRRHRGGLRAAVFGAMMLESVVLALGFGLVVSVVTTQLLGSLGALALNAGGALGWWTQLMVSLGAGLYEELLFRVLLAGGLAWALRAGLGWRPAVAGGTAVLVSALVFSAFHYVGPYGDTLQLTSFVFRAVAGIFFSALYVTRGFGITAWTHALYDVFLLVLG
jgi:hypothetical protein